MDSLNNMSDDLLTEAYMKAIDLNLDQDFRDLIVNEIMNRGLMVPYQKSDV